MGCFNIYCFLSIAFLLLTFISTTVRGVKLAHSSPTTTTTSSSSSFHNGLQFEFPHDHRSSDIMVGDSVQIHWKRNSTTDPMDSGIFFAALHPSSQTQTPDQLQSQPSWQIPLRLEKIFGLRNHDSSPSASVVADPIIDLSELELDTHTERRYHGKELEEGDRAESKMRRPALVVEDRMATIRKVVTVEVGQNEGIITLPTFYHGAFCFLAHNSRGETLARSEPFRVRPRSRIAGKIYRRDEDEDEEEDDDDDDDNNNNNNNNNGDDDGCENRKRNERNGCSKSNSSTQSASRAGSSTSSTSTNSTSPTSELAASQSSSTPSPMSTSSVDIIVAAILGTVLAGIVGAVLIYFLRRKLRANKATANGRSTSPMYPFNQSPNQQHSSTPGIVLPLAERNRSQPSMTTASSLTAKNLQLQISANQSKDRLDRSSDHRNSIIEELDERASNRGREGGGIPDVVPVPSLDDPTRDPWESKNFYATPKKANPHRVNGRTKQQIGGMSKRKAPSSGVSRSTKSTTKSTTSSGTRRTFGGSSVFTGSENMTEVSSIKFSPNTERQMEIDERIQELQGKLALLQRTISNGNGLGREGKTGSVTLANMTHDYRVWKWKKQIDRLKALKDSDWAWGKTDVVPPGLYKYDGTSTFNQS